jgi:hypothetical protein
MQSQKVAELQHSQKLVEELDTAAVRQTRMITGDPDVSWRIWHFNSDPIPVNRAFRGILGCQNAPDSGHTRPSTQASQ